MPPQRPYTAEMTSVCLIVPVISPVCDPASRKPPHTRPHRITEITARDNRAGHVLYVVVFLARVLKPGSETLNQRRFPPISPIAPRALRGAV